MAVPNDIILGDGVFSIGGTDVGLTRGGGTFTVEREYRVIEADGDYGAVKGRIRKVKSTPKLTINMLEVLGNGIEKLYPALTETLSGSNNMYTSTTDIVDGDYQSTVKWTGYTKGGKAVVIELQNAINLENIEWSLVDKEEVVPVVTYTAAYLESARTTEPWKITYTLS